MMQIFIPPWIWRPSRSGSSDITLGVEKLEWYGYLMEKKFEVMFSGLNRIQACDGRTSWDNIVSAMHALCAVKMTDLLHFQHWKIKGRNYGRKKICKPFFLTQMVKFTSVNEQCVAIPRRYVCCTFWSADFFCIFLYSQLSVIFIRFCNTWYIALNIIAVIYLVYFKVLWIRLLIYQWCYTWLY